MSVEKTPKTNQLGLTRKDYSGSPSTLCVGCGHDSVTNQIISALFKSGVKPTSVIKLSGIGCSSKTPNYFLNQSHGFNSIHGRMAPLATGAKLANRNLMTIGVSGDGDTASIGLGGFAHLLRRNLPMIYLIENNGVYGLTKGQFSATADYEAKAKTGELNPFKTVDLCSLAIEMGCGFVARSFSGDMKQMIPLIEAATRHEGTALIDVLSPCVTFANHDGSTKSYDYVKEHKVSLQELGFVQPNEEITVDYEEGTQQTVKLPDGSQLILNKLEKEYDYSNALRAQQRLSESRHKGEVLTGLIYYDPMKTNLIETLNLAETPLSELNENELRPSHQQLQEILTAYE